MNAPLNRHNLRETIDQIAVLLERQKIVEQLVERQESRRHQLVESLVHRQHLAELQTKLQRLHAADLAQVIETFPPEQRLLLWEQIYARRGGEVLLAMNDEERESLIGIMPPSQLKAVLSQLDADDMAWIAGDVPPEALQERLMQLTADDRQWFQVASTYPESTVGSLMTNEMATAYDDATQADTVAALRKLQPFPSQTDKLFVTDRRGHFRGIVTMQALLLAEPDALIGSLMSTDVVSFHPEDNARDAAQAFDRYDLVSAPVLSDRGSLIGRLTVDTVIDFMRQRSDDSVLSIAGLTGGEDLFASIWRSAQKRWPWLFINLFTAFIASLVIGAFEDTISRLVALAALMPIVASLGGNTGNQTSAILIRRLSQSGISGSAFSHLAKKEIGVSAVNGVVLGLVVGTFAFVLYRDAHLSMVIALAVLSILLVAAIVGLFVPTTLERIGRDPALGSSILLTATTDILGFLIFLGLASLLLVQ